MHLALFDFDGTITDRDSLLDFLIYVFGRARCVMGALALGPMMGLYLLGVIPNWRAKEAVFGHFMRGWDVDGFREACENYSRMRLPAIIRPIALEKLAWHRSEGHRMIVVSASVEEWFRGWCGRNGMEVIGTRLEAREGRLTGRIDGSNCNGSEKVRRIRDSVDLDCFERIYAYGNSGGDTEMLTLADERYYNWSRIA